jgi:hypothetical protein
MVGAATTIPPTLAALEQQWAELKITSLRYTSKTSFQVTHGGRKLRCLLRLLGGGSQSGEYTTTPAAASVSFELFGTKWRLRQVGTAVYEYVGPLARYDRGRPWVRLGKGGLSELFTVNGHHVRSAPPRELLSPRPPLTEPPFSQLNKLLAGAHEIRELGSATVDGQSVTRFLVTLEPAQLETEVSAVTSSVGRVAASSTATLELALAASGLPVRTEVTVHASEVTSMATVEVPAVNFPLVISAPPAAKTTTLRRLQQLARHGHLKQPAKSKHPRNPFRESCR